MVVAEEYIQCQGEVFTTLDTLNPGNKTLYLCPWSKRPLLKHYKLVRGFQKCEIVPEESLYLNGTWQQRPPYDTALSTLSVEIGQDPAAPSDMLFLKVRANLKRSDTELKKNLSWYFNDRSTRSEFSSFRPSLTSVSRSYV